MILRYRPLNQPMSRLQTPRWGHGTPRQGHFLDAPGWRLRAGHRRIQGPEEQLLDGVRVLLAPGLEQVQGRDDRFRLRCEELGAAVRLGAPRVRGSPALVVQDQRAAVHWCAAWQ